MRTIILRGGYFAKVDDEDYEALSSMKWHRSCRGYAQRCPKPGVTFFMHHDVLGGKPIKGQVDHINGDKLDNRKSNLRVCDASRNCHNRYHDRPFRGVSKRPNGKFQAEFTVRRVKHYVGVFDTPEEAAEAAKTRRLAMFADE